jgi:hypothetical protein
VAGAFALCPLVAALAPADPSAPLARMRALTDVQRDLGLHPEPAMAAWLSARPGLLTAALAIYVLAHLPATVGVLVWARLERPAAFPALRDTFVAMQVLLLAVAAAVPTAPPRMLEAGDDGIAALTGSAGLAAALQSPYAAIPSGHAAFALFTAAALLRLTRHRAVHAAAVAYPALIIAITLATRNHLWIDAAAAATTLAIATTTVHITRRATRPGRSRTGRPARSTVPQPTRLERRIADG